MAILSTVGIGLLVVGLVVGAGLAYVAVPAHQVTTTSTVSLVSTLSQNVVEATTVYQTQLVTDTAVSTRYATTTVTQEVVQTVATTYTVLTNVYFGTPTSLTISMTCSGCSPGGQNWEYELFTHNDTGGVTVSQHRLFNGGVSLTLLRENSASWVADWTVDNEIFGTTQGTLGVTVTFSTGQVVQSKSVSISGNYVLMQGSIDCYGSSCTIT